MSNTSVRSDFTSQSVSSKNRNRREGRTDKHTHTHTVHAFTSIHTFTLKDLEQRFCLEVKKKNRPVSAVVLF